MLTFAYYILKVVICSAVLYGYYLAALRNEIFHHWNRFYLLASVILALGAPLISINIWQNQQQPVSQVIHLIQSVNSNDEFVYEFSKHQQSFHMDAANVSAFMYMLISGLLLAFLIQTLIRINKLKHSNVQTIVEGINFINTDAKGTPFSFFNNIFWNINIDLNTSSGKQIFKHEVAHVHEKHSYDKIFMNIILILFWCNPIFWIIKKELNLIHEFIADKKAVEDSDTASFALMILQATYPQQQFSITNNFFYSPLKRRIRMLTKNKNPRINYLSRLCVLPIAAVVFFAFTLKAKMYRSNLYHGKKITVIIDAGHGGSDKGASNKGINEKDITLALAKEIKELNTNDHIEVLLTRKGDSVMSVQQRVGFAKEQTADLFISIHLDAEIDKNKHSGMSVLIPGTVNTFFNASNILGSDIIESFKNNYKLPVANNLIQRERGVLVLNNNNCAAVLIHAGFLTTDKDMEYLIKPENQKRIAQNILNGINSYAKQSSTSAALLSGKLKTTINDSIPQYYKGKKIKEAYGSNKLRKALIVYQDGTKDTISIQEAEKIRLIPPPPPPPYNGSDIQNTNAVIVKAGKGDNNNNTDPPPFRSFSRDGDNLKIINWKSTATSDMPAMSADMIAIVKPKDAKDYSNLELIIINGKTYEKHDLEGKMITAKEGKFYPKNDPEAIRLYGDAAKNGAMIFTEATITENKQKATTDTIPEKVFTKVELEASFPGGAESWRRYITRVMQENIKELSTEDISGTCRLRFIVNEDGTVTNVTALTLNGTKLAEVAMNAIKKGPKWNPAKQNGYVVAAYREQPITFTITEN